MGSRNDQTTVYWTSKNDIQIICGCFRGGVKEFQIVVKNKYPDQSH